MSQSESRRVVYCTCWNRVKKKKKKDFESLVLRKFRKITAISHPCLHDTGPRSMFTSLTVYKHLNHKLPAQTYVVPGQFPLAHAKCLTQKQALFFSEEDLTSHLDLQEIKFRRALLQNSWLSRDLWHNENPTTLRPGKFYFNFQDFKTCRDLAVCTKSSQNFMTLPRPHFFFSWPTMQCQVAHCVKAMCGRPEC